MDKSEKNNKYEMVMIVDANLSSSEKDAVIKDVSGTIAKDGGKVINSKVWLDRQKFTFHIKKASEGTYYLVNFEANGSAMAKLKVDLKLNEKILRSSIISVDAHQTLEVLKA